MFPIPSIKFIPRIFQSDNKAITFAAFLDSYLMQIRDDVLRLPRTYRADEVNSIYLEELGYFLNANIKNIDTDATKRKKIFNAVATHKLRGTWVSDAKKRIDNITGYDSAIITAANSADWILVGDEATSFVYYATMGVDGIDNGLGLDLIGEGTEIEIAGNIYINLHQGIYTAVLSNAIILQIVAEIKDDVVPAYNRIYLGYVDASGNFNIYANGVIG